MTAAISFRRNLFLASPMMRGDDVLAVQNALVGNGASMSRDGLFGVATQTAVRSFQSRSGLVADGIVGPATWDALLDEGGGPAPGNGADARARHCFEVLQTHRFTAEQACGIVANIGRESRFDPGAVGDGLQAYGLAQWHPDRQNAFQARFARSIVGSSAEDQLGFIDFEMREGREHRAGDRLAAALTAREAGEIVSRYYERPAAADAEAQLRGASADAYFRRFATGDGSVSAAKPAGAPFRTASDILGSEQVEELMRPHRLFLDSVQWALTAGGVAVDGGTAAAVTNPDRVLVSRVWEEQRGVLVSVLGNGQVPAELVLACLCAVRPLNGAVQVGYGGDLLDNNRTPDCVSAGPMQATLSSARIALNRPGLTVDDLRQPDTSIRAGAAIMWLQAAETLFDPVLVAASYSAGVLRYNAGSRWKLLEYPALGADFVDRFVRFFDAAMQSLDANTLPPSVSSFQRLVESPFLPFAASGNGPYVARNPLAWSNSAPVPDGQCVALVKRATGAPATAQWLRGALARGNADIRPGTAIATFDDDGRYGNHTDGRSHAALFVAETTEGLRVVDQWLRQPPHERVIRFDAPDNPKADRGESFHVIM